MMLVLKKVHKIRGQNHADMLDILDTRNLHTLLMKTHFLLNSFQLESQDVVYQVYMTAGFLGLCQ